MTPRQLSIGLVLALALHLLGARLAPDFPRWIDLFLVLTVLNGLERRSLSGLIGGLACGLVHDALSGEIYGLHAFADTLVGYLTAKVSQRLETQRPAGLLVLFCFASALQRVTLFLLVWLLLPEPVLPPLPWAVVPVAAGSLLGLGLYLGSREIGRRRRNRERIREAKLKL